MDGSGRRQPGIPHSRRVHHGGVDGSGNVGYQASADGMSYVRLRSGSVVRIGGVESRLQSGAGRSMFGTVSDAAGKLHVARWQVDPATGSIFTQPIAGLQWVAAAGTDGTVVGDRVGVAWPDRGQRGFVKPGAPLHNLPAQFREDKWSDEPPVVVNPAGSVVYTRTYGLPRMVTCTA